MRLRGIHTGTNARPLEGPWKANDTNFSNGDCKDGPGKIDGEGNPQSSYFLAKATLKSNNEMELFTNACGELIIRYS